MPSASRPFTAELVVDLVRRGVAIAPILLHTGVSSLEGNELPVPRALPRARRDGRAPSTPRTRAGGRVIAVGTTVVRALETVTDDRGVVHPGAGWTELVVTARTRRARGRRPAHRVARARGDAPADARGDRRAARARARLRRGALDAGYLWHEFGDSHLLLPGRGDVDERATAIARDAARRPPRGALRVAPPRAGDGRPTSRGSST